MKQLEILEVLSPELCVFFSKNRSSMSTNRFANSASLMYLGRNLKILITVSPGDLISFLSRRKQKQVKTVCTQVPTSLYMFLYNQTRLPPIHKVKLSCSNIFQICKYLFSLAISSYNFSNMQVFLVLLFLHII
jgi:hypothetical protein